MRFPNAYSGVSKIYLAELLAILAAVCAIIGVIFTLAGVGAAAVTEGQGGSGFAIGGGIFLTGTSILMVVSFVINIIGISNASKDEPAFKTALIMVIIGIAASVCAGIFSNKTVIYNIATIVGQLCEIAVFWLCIGGIRNLATALRNNGIVNKCDSLSKLIVGVYLVAIILAIINAFVTFPHLLENIIAIVTSLCMIFAYFMYLNLLSGAKNMLAQ